MLEVVYKQCLHMRRGRNISFNLCSCSLSSCSCPCSAWVFCSVILEEPMDNSQSIRSNDSTHSSQYSGPIAVLKVFQLFYLINHLLCTVSDG